MNVMCSWFCCLANSVWCDYRQFSWKIIYMVEKKRSVIFFYFTSFFLYCCCVCVRQCESQYMCICIHNEYFSMCFFAFNFNTANQTSTYFMNNNKRIRWRTENKWASLQWSMQSNLWCWHNDFVLSFFFAFTLHNSN